VLLLSLATLLDSQYEPHAIAATYLFVSLPWSVIAIYCPFRYLSLTISVFSICRVFYGPWFVHKLFLIFYEMSATVYVRYSSCRVLSCLVLSQCTGSGALWHMSPVSFDCD
jgi:hypothetical protein